MNKLFISRKLSPTSIFWGLLIEGYKIVDQSFIEFSLIPFVKIPDSEWLFFYSKNGVDFFHKGLEKLGKSFPKCKIACMGKGTANCFQKIFKIPPDFIGSGKPRNVAAQFSNMIERNTKVTFITAEDSKNSIFNLLKEEYDYLDSTAVYNNKIKNISLNDAFNILIFTSPKNAVAYYKNNPIDNNNTVISIGKTTAHQLHKIGIEEVIIAVDPSEIGLLNAVKILYP